MNMPWDKKLRRQLIQALVVFFRWGQLMRWLLIMLVANHVGC